MSGHTKGPWSVVQNEKWPFGIKIEPEILRMDCYAHSTSQKTLDDMRNALGFPNNERAGIITAIQEQESNARLIAAAPDLLEALKECRAAMYADNPADGWFEIIKSADAAISKATGAA